MLEEQRLEMPAVPGRPLPAALGEEEEAQPAVAEATAAQLAQLPSVPSTKVEAPAAADKEAEREQEAALVAA